MLLKLIICRKSNYKNSADGCDVFDVLRAKIAQPCEWVHFSMSVLYFYYNVQSKVNDMKNRSDHMKTDS